jgi:hypothetical protein
MPESVGASFGNKFMIFPRIDRLNPPLRHHSIALLIECLHHLPERFTLDGFLL